MRYVLMLVDRTFTGGKKGSPLPSYFGPPAAVGSPNDNIYSQQYSSNQGAIGVMASRWNNDDTGGIPGITMRGRTKLLIDNIAALCDGHPSFEGLYFQETAGGLDDGQKVATGYTAHNYRDYYIDILTYAANKMPNSRIFWCLNYIPATSGGGHSNELADDVLAAVQPLNAIVFGGPDCLPESGGLRNEEYQYMGSANFTLNGQTCHGYKNKIPISIQVSPPCYAQQWKEDPLPARYWGLDELYGFMNNTDSFKGNALHASYVFWYAVNGSGTTAADDLGPQYNGWKGGTGYATPTGQTIASQHHQIFNYTGPR